ncbi:MAG: 16S rRNA (uracil(1498)-N(3))-methyltransferase [Bacteroidales bacterium]|nr:16S rRNA (uracil(1498)-N(3))-methyltransferase [Bacteroidales bacterium]
MEQRLFYNENIIGSGFELDKEESGHIIRVLRMKPGDEMDFTDGKGNLFHCVLSIDNPKACKFEILSSEQGKDKRDFNLHIAVAPTKNISRYEWFLEKATEIGVDTITPFFAKHSERKIIKTDRLERVITAAMKQSLKTFHPLLEEEISFSELVKQPFDGQKFIAYIDEKVTTELSKTYQPGNNAVILIGPEGGFHPDEVELAKTYGFIPVKLGPYRLRTETAAITACHTIQLANY